MYTSANFSVSDKDKVKIDVSKTEHGKIYVRIGSEDYSGDVNLFLTPDIADDLGWRIQTAVRHYESNASQDV